MGKVSSNELSVPGEINKSNFEPVQDESRTLSALSLKTDAAQIDGTLYVGKDAGGRDNIYGDKLEFLGASLNTDPLWMARYNYSSDKSALRMNIGDNNTSAPDQFEVGATYYKTKEYQNWLMVKDGNTRANGNMQATKSLIAEKLDVGGFEMDSIRPRSEAPKSAKIESLLVDTNTGKIYYE